MDKKIIFVLVTAVIVFAGIYIFLSSTTGQLTAKDELAKCLSIRNATFYGASWCGHCQNQKSLFGDSFQYVKYVECTENQELCQSAGVTAYPTWIINGQKYEGELSLSMLAKLADCPVP